MMETESVSFRTKAQTITMREVKYLHSKLQEVVKVPKKFVIRVCNNINAIWRLVILRS